LLAVGDASVLPELRGLAADPRWRIREAVAIALQRMGEVDFPALLEEMRRWAAGTALERRPSSPRSAGRGSSQSRRASEMCWRCSSGDGGASRARRSPH